GRGLGRQGQDRRRPARARRRRRHHGVARAGDEQGRELMPIAVNKAVVGKEYPPFPVTVERGRINDFARAIGGPMPSDIDDAVGAAAPWGDVIAPPTFAVSFRGDGADSGALLRDLGVDISRVLHGEQEFEIHRQLVPGETYLCRTKVVDLYEKT